MRTSTYIQAIKNVIERETRNNHYCKYIDINTEFKEQNDYAKNLLNDYCHPNASGNRVIGNYVTKQLETALGISSESVELEKDIPRLPNDFETNSSAYEKVDTIKISRDENGNWSYNVSDLGSNSKDYVYYVKEIVPEGWEVSYEHNGQEFEKDNAIQIINKKTTEKTSITVNKKWNDGNASDRPDSITLTLQRKTETEGEWSDVEVTQPTPTKNGATWTYTYSNLPKDDGNDNNYQYRIVETVPTGYTVEYVNGGVAGADGNISLTNTKSVSIKLNKIWSDNEHMGDTITVKLHRSTTQKGDASLPLVMSINGQASMQTGSTQTLTANRNNIIWSSSDTNVATIDTNGLVTAIKAGTTTITAKCGSETATFVITVSDKPTVQLAKSSVNITLGENASDLVTLLGISMSDGTATYSYSGYDSSVISISDGKVTALKAGNTTITVTATTSSGDTSTAKATVNVVYPANFSITGGDSVSVGATLDLSINPNSGKFTWSSSDESIATVDQNGTVTGVGAGKVIITATRDDSTEVNPKVAIKEITVLEEIKEENVKSGSFTLVYGSCTDLAPNVYVEKIVFDWSKTSGDVWIGVGTNGGWSNGYDSRVNLNDSDSLEIEVKANCTHIHIGYPSGITSETVISYKIYYGNGVATVSRVNSLRSAPRAVSRMNSASPLTETSQSIKFDSNGVAEVELKYTDVVNGQHWKKLIENLPAYDENNQQYYYWVEEIEVNGYTVSYLFSDDNSETQYCIDALQLGSGEITIKNTKVESSSVEMPSTGGKGVKWYYVTGMAVMFVSAAGILIRRRKNPVK